MRIEMSPQLQQHQASADFTDHARLFAKCNGDLMAMAEIARSSPLISERLRGILAKAAVAPDFEGTTSYRSIAAGFVESLKNFGVFDRVLGDGAFRRVPIQVRARTVTLAPTGAVAGRGKPKAISSFELSDNALARRKAHCIVVATKELLDAVSAPAMTLFARELRVGVAGATDADFIAQVLASPTDLATITATGNFPDDLAAMFQELPSTGSTSKLYLIVAPDVARMIAGMPGESDGLRYPNMTVAGGSIGRLVVLVSDEMAAGSALLVDADSIAADSEEVRLDSASHASIQMSDTPADAAADLVSLWQTGAKALRAERFYGFEILRWNIVYATDLVPTAT